MRTRVSVSPKSILVLQLIAATLIPIVLVLLSILDGIVNGDLYNYGLTFSEAWAINYQAYKLMALFFVVLFAAAVAASASAMLLYNRAASRAYKTASLLAMAAGVVFISASIIYVLRIDGVVNNDLYHFGLQFNGAWAISYWNVQGLLLGFEGAAAVTGVFASALTASSMKTQIEISPITLASPVLLLTGILTLALSILYSSSTPAFVGLGLIFWGAILSYVRDPDSKQAKLTEAALDPSLATLDQLVREMGFAGPAFYLPPRYFKDPEATKVLILKQKQDRFPTPREIQNQETQPQTPNSPFLQFKPPGAGLLNLFERTLNTSFTRTDLTYVQRTLPRLLIEDLEMADNVKIEVAGRIVRVIIENTMFRTDTAHRDADANPHIGSVLASAIACVLAKATGQSIAATKERTTPDMRTVNIEYSIVEESQGEQQ